MTLVGKIFTVLILLMSTLFMAFAVMLFATHRNWKEYATNPTAAPGKPLGLEAQLAQMKQAKADADAQIQKLRDELRTEMAARTHAIAVLAARNVRLDADLSAKQGELDRLSADNTQASAAAKTAQDRLVELEKQIAAIRSDLRKTQEDLDTQMISVVKLTDELIQAVGLRDQEKEKNTQAVLQLAAMKLVMETHGLTIDTPVAHIPPKVEGVVLEVSDKDLIEISIGKDDGLKEGHSLEVFRGNTYLGRIIIRRTAPDRAVGQIIKELQRGQIKRGDRVSTKLS